MDPYLNSAYRVADSKGLIPGRDKSAKDKHSYGCGTGRLRNKNGEHRGAGSQLLSW